MVGAPGFEPGTSRTPSVRATRLRYAPTGQPRRPTAPHAAISRLSPAFEQRQESAQRIAQIEEHFAVEELRGVFSVRQLVRRFADADAAAAA